MHKLGISVYPEHSTPEKDRAYLEQAAAHGFSRIFTCLLSVNKSPEETVEEFSAFVSAAHDLGFEVAADTNPAVFRHLGATPEDLSVFERMGLDIIRLDGNFGEMGDRLITRNPQGIKIEFNASSDVTLDHLIAHGADPANIVVCHNFYPERYSGLSWDVFSRFNEKWRALGLRTAAFVSSNNDPTFGPWPVAAGLPTLEQHRGLPVDVQLRHLIATEMIDDIIVGNAFASEDELASMAACDLTRTTVTVQTGRELCANERLALTGFAHCGRADASAYFIRSSWPRMAFKDAGAGDAGAGMMSVEGAQAGADKSIPAVPCEKSCFTRGDVLVVNDNLKHYRGEVEVALCDIPNDGERNLVGRIPDEELMILDCMERNPDHFFGFIVK